MADEWNNIGWTSQKGVVTFDNSGLAPWKIPADIQTVKVTAEYQSASGGRARGFVQFRPMVDVLTHLPTKANIIKPKWTAAIGQDGLAILNIPATDATALSPNPFVYEVLVTVNYRVVERFTCSLPAATPEIDINDITRN
ncbi:hypothetical protein [Terracoccus sp. 273MFTsu3.1]|uniref:hypothetical protein n=1 Tax=Terracoccus sp. 273MFTsu3.1 TaxID=1172188 RepID=UPI000364ABF2|nr:hypothetical protein [Terracoccus sp. 273MFTsu3.1]